MQVQGALSRNMLFLHLLVLDVVEDGLKTLDYMLRQYCEVVPRDQNHDPQDNAPNGCATCIESTGQLVGQLISCLYQFCGGIGTWGSWCYLETCTSAASAKLVPFSPDPAHYYYEYGYGQHATECERCSETVASCVMLPAQLCAAVSTSRCEIELNRDKKD